MSEEITNKNQNLKSLHGQFVEIDEDIKRFRAEFSEKEVKVRDLEEKVRLRESQLADLRLRLAQRDSQLEKMNMKSQRSAELLNCLQAPKKFPDNKIGAKTLAVCTGP